VLRGADQADPWRADARTRTVTGSPGTRLSLAVAPRFTVIDGLSFLSGWEGVRDGDATWRTSGEADGSVGDGTPGFGALPVNRPARTSQRVFAQLNFDGSALPVGPALRFPVEVMVRGGRTVVGSEGALAETSLTLGGRWVRGR
jgi:hypothetical protein